VGKNLGRLDVALGNPRNFRQALKIILENSTFFPEIVFNFRIFYLYL
jgi:hypothetical protein